MRILVDENIPSMTVRALREIGHDVADVRATTDKGASDARLWEIVLAEHRLLITTDKGFARRRREEHAGVLIVLLRQPNRHRIHERVMNAMKGLDAAQWPRLLVVVRDRTRSTWRARGGRR
ncbi:MAG TPA: DUF5615 family PIN-like protein [Phycisphaerae bacterium]|nr:DUF5615 family PIN-like protein [Phycisphaerae bacterium]